MSGPESIGKSLAFLVFNYFAAYQLIKIISIVVFDGYYNITVFHQYLLLPIVFIFAGYICGRNEERVIRFNTIFLIFLGVLPVTFITVLVSYSLGETKFGWYIWFSFPPSVLLGAYIYHKQLGTENITSH
jgi:hypothetical protein